MKNNIIADHTSGLSEDSPTVVVIDADTNLYWNGTNPIVGANATIGDPKLAPHYQPLENSLALDAGVNISWLTEDILDRPRPWNAYDLGAYEDMAELDYMPLVLRD